MQYFSFFFNPDRNPLLPILVVLAAFVALAPEFEVPQSARIGHFTQPGQVAPAAESNPGRHEVPAGERSSS